MESESEQKSPGMQALEALNEEGYFATRFDGKGNDAQEVAAIIERETRCVELAAALNSCLSALYADEDNEQSEKRSGMASRACAVARAALAKYRGDK